MSGRDELSEEAIMLREHIDGEEDIEAGLNHSVKRRPPLHTRRWTDESLDRLPIRTKPRRWLIWPRRITFSLLLLLSFFGAIHILHVLSSSDGLFLLTTPSLDPYWPDWDQPGQPGQNIAHYPTDSTRDITPIPCHSHNDYWRRIPLHEALHYGYTGVEADVWLKHDELYVGHSTASLTRNRTFNAMYINPLVALLERMNPQTEFGSTSGHGVFDTDPSQTLVLLVDFKTGGRETWPAVVAQLAPLRNRGYLSSWNGSATTYRAITVVATGNAPFDLLVANTTYRDIFFDAPLDRLAGHDRASDLGEGDGDAGQGHTGLNGTERFNRSNSYYASTSLLQAVGPLHRGKFSAAQIEVIRAQIKAAEDVGLMSRYWETPAWPVSARNYVWTTLVDEGVKVLNVDDLRDAARRDWTKSRHGIL